MNNNKKKYIAFQSFNKNQLVFNKIQIIKQFYKKGYFKILYIIIYNIIISYQKKFKHR